MNTKILHCNRCNEPIVIIHIGEFPSEDNLTVICHKCKPYLREVIDRVFTQQETTDDTE